MTQATNKKPEKTGSDRSNSRIMVFGKQNYLLMIIGIVLIVIGFALMYGPADGDIFEPRRITVAPLVVLSGLVVEVFAILRRPKD